MVLVLWRRSTMSSYKSAGFGGVHGLQGEVVEDEDFDAGEGTHLGLDAVVQLGRLERAGHLVGADEPDGAATAAGDVPERDGQVGLMPTSA